MTEQELIDTVNAFIDADVRAHCPACASGFEKEVHACGEGEYIRACAEPGETFKAFVIRIRAGNNTVTIKPLRLVILFKPIEALLEALNTLPCFVMISTYDSSLYQSILKGWHAVSFETRTRSGARALEKVWMNYNRSQELHDYRYLGSDFRERERISRKRQRWINRFKALPAAERHAILECL